MEDFDQEHELVLKAVPIILGELVQPEASSTECTGGLCLDTVSECARLIATHSPSTQTSDILQSFLAPKVPSISLSDYFARFHRISGSSTACYILALIYIERLIQKDDVTITWRHIHRLALTSWVVSSKYWDDEIYNLHVYAKIGGLKSEELKKLEAEFLCRLGFDLFVSEKEFMTYYNLMVRRSPTHTPSTPSPMHPPIRECARVCAWCACLCVFIECTHP